MKTKITIIHIFYYHLFELLKQTFFGSLFVASPAILYSCYDYTFQISKFHLKCFLFVYFIIFFVLYFKSFKRPRKLTKLERRLQRKQMKKIRKLNKKFSIFKYFLCFVFTFLFYFLQNLFLDEATIILILYYPSFYNTMLLLQLINQIFLIEKLLMKKLKLILLKSYYSYYILVQSEPKNFDLINLYIKSNLTPKGKYIQINFNATIQSLIEMIETIYGKNYKNIRYKGKSLVCKNVQNLLLWGDYQMHDNSEIEVIVENLDGGAPRKKKRRVYLKKKCFGCKGYEEPTDLCLCNLCVNCRLNCLTCNCCGHNKRQRCIHGICFDRCINNNTCFKCEKCDCYDAPVDRERDYDRDSRHKRIPSPPKKHSRYPSFPILLHGPKNNFPNLSDFSWLQFQCILCWDFCKKNHLKINVATTQLFFFKNQFQNILSNHDIQVLWYNYQKNKISASHFFPPPKTIINNDLEQNNDFLINLKTQFIDPLVNQIIKLHLKHQNFTLISILEQIVFGLDELHPSFVRQSLFHPMFLKFSIHALKSTADVLKTVNLSKNLTTREKNEFLHTILFSMLLHNQNQFKIEDLQQFFSTTPNLIKASIAHINDFKAGRVTSFKRQYKKRQKFCSHAFKLMYNFYVEFSIPWEGNRMSSGPDENGIEVEHHKHFLPWPYKEAYHYFCEHPDYGPKCFTVKGVQKCPGETLFREQRPFWIVPHPKIRTGFCPHCLKIREQLKTFQSIVKKYCSCGDVKCGTFFHEEGCLDYFNSSGEFCICKKCCCDKCCKCECSKLTIFSEDFLDFLNCKEQTISGHSYPKLNCLLNPKTCSCSFCHLPDSESLVNRFCQSAFENIDRKSDVNTKDWAKEVVKTSNSRFKTDILQTKTVNVVTFLDDFHDFLTMKRGFIWHHHVGSFQRYHYKQMILKYQKGILGDSSMMFTMDFAFDYTIKDSKCLSAAQFFSAKHCQINGIVEYSNFEGQYKGCSNFVFSDQHVRKNAATAIGDIKERIEFAKKKNKNLKVIHIFSDGATNEFMNRKIFGNMQNLSKELNLIIIWNYFGIYHGKAICDSEFARAKTKLDREFIDKLDKNGIPYTKNAEGIFLFFNEELNWSCKGKQITERSFHLRSENEDSFSDYKTVSDTRLSRCVMWDQDGNFYQKYNSCSCEHCVETPLNSSSCKNVNFTGSWKLRKLTKTNPPKKASRCKMI